MKKIFLVLIVLLFVSNFALAQSTVIPNPLNTNSFAELLDALINWIINIALILTPLIIVYGGVVFITAGGNPSKAGTAKAIMLNASIGLILALLAKTLVDVIRNLVVK